MLGKRPNKKTVDRMRGAIKAAQDKAGDPERALQIWKDLRWKVQTTASSYEDIQRLAAESIARAKAELFDPKLRQQVIRQLEAMVARSSEFTVDEGAPAGELCFCSVCGKEILPGVWRKELPGDIKSFACELCSAIAP